MTDDALQPLKEAILMGLSQVMVLRRQLAQAEHLYREQAKRVAVRLAELEQLERRRTEDNCLQLEKIRCGAHRRLEQLSAGAPERFPGERALAEMAVRDVERWELRDSTEYTVIYFAHKRDRLRLMIGGQVRETVVQEAIERGGVHDHRGRFTGILR